MAPRVPPKSDLTPVSVRLCIFLGGTLSWIPRELSPLPPHRVGTGERKLSGQLAPRRGLHCIYCAQSPGTRLEKLHRAREQRTTFLHRGEKSSEAYPAAEHLDLESL